MLANVGPKPVFSSNGLLTTICYVINGDVQYALEGAVEVAGAGIDWANSTMNLFKDFDDFD